MLAKLGLAMLSGGLLAAAFPPGPMPWLALVAAVPLLRALEGLSLGRAAAVGWVAGLTACGLAYLWLPATIERLQQSSGYEPTVVFVLFVAYHALQLALFGLGVAVINRGIEISDWAWFAVPSGWAVASWWVWIEWAFPKILPWHLGDALAASPSLRQSADLLGVHGLSYLMMMTATWLANALTPGYWRPQRIRAGLSAVALLTAMAIYGWLRLLGLGSDSGRLLTATLIQTGSATAEGSAESSWEVYEHLTREAAAETLPIGAGGMPGLVLWPETALPVDLGADRVSRQRLQTLVDELRTPVLVGALAHGDDQSEHNAMFLVRPSDRTLASHAWTDALEELPSYRKQRLVPFGEYVPAASWLPIAGWRTTGRFAAAEGAQVLPFSNDVALAPSICFEAMWPGSYNDLVLAGGGVLVNLSDDAWFQSRAEAEQHLAAASLRAVETRRWLARASGSGISAIIDPYGRIVASLPFGESGVIQHTIAARDRLPLYLYVGNVIVGFACLNLLWFGVRVRSEADYAHQVRIGRLSPPSEHLDGGKFIPGYVPPGSASPTRSASPRPLL